ncbi:porin family protein [Emticicia sp. BO119]|uniref:porin family protein n=1 Tax=Emticicia sp. BO119 TaxID=2757768 RepID=UPI001E643A63|nr:porin family protein [Emticicia sp. BO119]
MKKIVQASMLISIIFLSALTFGQAQEATRIKQKTANTYIDIMVNMASTNLNYGASNTALSDYKKSAKGIQAGVSVQKGITPAFSLVTELYFMRKGGKLTASNPFTSAESNLRLNTLELPVLARVHIGKVLYLNAGPSVAYNMSGKNTIGEVTNKIAFGNSANGFKRFEAGVQVGGGLSFPLKQKRIALDVRYNYGLTNISYNKEMFNRGLMISVNFSKALNKK